MLGTILLIILILILIGALPTWPYSSGWGYYPSGGVGLVAAHRDGPAADGANIRPQYRNVTLNEPNWVEAVLLEEFGRAQHLRVGEAHAAIQDGEAGLGLGDERPVADAQAVAVGVAVEEDVAGDRLAVEAGKQIPAEAAVADEGLRTRQRRPRARRAEIVAQVLADARRAADAGIGRRRCRAPRRCAG